MSFPIAERPVWWMQLRAFRVAWGAAGACWMALAIISLLRPSLLTPRPLSILFITVAAGKALVLLWTSPRDQRARRLALGATVGSALGAIGCVDSVLAVIEVPVLVIIVGAGNLAIAAVVWRQ